MESDFKLHITPFWGRTLINDKGDLGNAHRIGCSLSSRSMETSKENIDSYLKSFIYCFPAWIWVRNITRVGKVQPAKNFISLVVGWDYAVLIKMVLFHYLSSQCKAPTLSLKTFPLVHGKYFIKKRNNSEMKMERECKLFF